MGPRITVVFLLFEAADVVRELVAAVVSQVPPPGASPDWMEVIFIDDASSDNTVAELKATLSEMGPPFRVRVLENEHNIGLARSLNRALRAVETEYCLTCHVDCRFASVDYVATAVDLLDRHPDVGAVAGQPIPPIGGELSQVEKVYLTANLMDVFPEGTQELEPVGFAEGRCDGFRMSAVRMVGYYDTTLRTAGEDQVLAARMRGAGFRVCRATALEYHLSVSSSQDSLLKLVRHARLFGRVTPYLLLANRGTFAGVVGGEAGRNLSMRTTLRGLQIAGALSWLGLSGSLLFGKARVPAGLATTAICLAKFGLFRPHMRRLAYRSGDAVVLAGLQPALDLAYTAGIVEGFGRLAKGGKTQVI
jgi:GT2 family glycosyltransferase